MNYKGKLYGCVNGAYFDTGKTSDDWDIVEAQDKTLIVKVGKAWDKDSYATGDFINAMNQVIDHFDSQRGFLKSQCVYALELMAKEIKDSIKD